MKPERLDNRVDDVYVLLLLLVVALSGFIIEGLRISDMELVQHHTWAIWSPGATY